MTDSDTLGGDATLLPGAAKGDVEEPRAPPRSIAGLALGRYRLERLLGKGSYGVVFLARDPDLDRKVALKVLRPRSDTSETARERFFREARVLASLVDPRVAAVFDVGSAPMAGALGLGDGEDEVFYIVMEYVAGTDLATWIAAQRHPWDDVVRVFVEAGRGLAAAHRTGVVHRDFKPSNVLMATDGSVKVADFGLAQGLGAMPQPLPPESDSAWSASTGADLTRSGAMLGTPMFMAPEQHEGDRLGPSADQFAFCVALYQGLTGRYPYTPGPYTALWTQKSKGSIAAWPAGASVPRWIRAVVERGLRPDPDARFESMDALLHRLEKSPTRRLAQASGWLLGPALIAGLGYAAYDATRPAHVSLQLRSSAGSQLQDVRVEVDGEELSMHGDAVKVRPGRHALEVRAEGHDPAVQVLEASAGADLQLALELPRHVGTLDVTAHPSAARILVDGVDHGSRVRDLPLPTGVHEVRVQLDDHFSQTMRWTIERGERRDAVVSLASVGVWEQPSAPPNQNVTWIPDSTGDGRSELFFIRGGIASIVDPWEDELVGTIRLSHSYVPARRMVDVDGDGGPELVSWATSADEQTLRVHDLRTLKDRWTRTFEGYGDVDSGVGVLGQSLAVVYTRGSVQAFDIRDGSPRWSAAMQGVLGMHELGDDAVLVTTEREAIVLGLDGEERWRRDGTRWLIAHDVDGDGAAEVVRADGPLALLDGGDGSRRWTLEVEGAHAELDDSGLLPSDVLGMRDRSGFIVVDAESGEVLRRIQGDNPTVHRVSSKLTVSAVRGDEVVLYDLEDGQALGSLPKDDVRLRTSGDFGGDGQHELLWTDADGSLGFYDHTLQRLATLESTKPALRLIDVHDANRDGIPDLLFENRRGLLVLTGPKRRWSVQSQHSVRAAPLAYVHDGVVDVVATLERRGKRHLGIIDGRSGSVALSPLKVGSDLHREAARADDVLYFSSRGGVSAYRLPTGDEVGSAELGALVYATPTVFDVDRDGDQEVLVGTFDQGTPTLGVFSKDLSTTEARVSIPQHVWARVVPFEDTVLMFGLQGSVFALDPTRGYVVRWQTEVGARINLAPAMFERSGRVVLALAVMGSDAEGDELVLLDATNGEVLVRHEGWAARGSTPLAFDADADGTPELYVADMDGKVRRLKGDGTVDTHVVHPGGVASAPMAAGRLRAEDPPVLVTSWGDGTLVVIDALTGALRWQTSLGARIEGRPLLLDLDGDGESEVVAATHEGVLVCLRSGPPTWAELRGE